MKTEPPSVSVRPLTDVRGSIVRTGYMSNDTENNENRAAARQQAARPCLRVGLRHDLQMIFFLSMALDCLIGRQKDLFHNEQR